MHPFVALMRTVLHRLHELPRPVALRRDHGARLRRAHQRHGPRAARRPTPDRSTDAVRAWRPASASSCTTSCSTATGSACTSASTPRCPAATGPRWRAGAASASTSGTARRLTENYVEQDYVAMQAQLATRRTAPARTLPTSTRGRPPKPVAADAGAEARRPGVARPRRPHRRRRASRSTTCAPARPTSRCSTSSRVTVNDLFSAGTSVPFHVTMHGTYRGGLGAALDDQVGSPASLTVVGIATRRRRRRSTTLDAITGRMQMTSELTGSTRSRVTAIAMGTRPDVDILDPRVPRRGPAPRVPVDARARAGVPGPQRDLVRHPHGARPRRRAARRRPSSRARATGRSGRRPRRR